MTSDTASNMEFGMRLHDAYDAMGPSQEAQDRVLAALTRAEHAQAQPRRRSPWLMVLPLAACLALVAVIVTLSATSAHVELQTNEAATEVTATNEVDKTATAAEEAAAVSDMLDGEVADASLEAYESVDESPQEAVLQATRASVRLLRELASSPLCL